MSLPSFIAMLLSANVLAFFTRLPKALPLRLSLLGIALALFGCAKAPESEQERISYFVGWEIGQNLKKQGLELNRAWVLKGLANAWDGLPPALDPAGMQNSSQGLQRMAQEKAKALAETNQKASAHFLAENRKNSGWKETASGLQYKVLLAGKGRRPGPKDTVQVHYTGTLLNGAKFDSSRDRAAPATVNVGQVIKGWSEALQLMSEGSHWVIVLPAHLGYGKTGSGGIPPESVLVFDLELKKIL